jgi:polar amino acid transport system substrate-binding protein
MRQSLWWSTNVLIAGGCDGIAPRGTPGRLVAVVWMLGGIAFTSYITAVFTSTLTVNRLDSAVHELKDLEGENIATVVGSSSADFLKKHGSKMVQFANIDEAMTALSRKDIKAVVYDAPIVRYWLNNHAGPAADYVLAGEPFARQHYAFALPMGSELRKEVNEALLQLKTSGRMEEINKRWFGGPASGAN